LRRCPGLDGIVPGSTFERGVENTDIDPAAERIMRGNAELFGGMRAL
jgi:hypothetical protein